MTQQEWLECTDPTPMLVFLRDKASDRKLRLFACACCRRIPGIMTDTPSRAVVEVTERYADGLASDHELAAAAEGEIWAPSVFAAKGDARLAAWFASRAEAGNAAPAGIAPWTEAREGVWRAARVLAWLAQAELLREIVGNPFLPETMDCAIRIWNDDTIPKLAQAIYDERTFDRLPVLADALQESGCRNEEILAHLRGLGPHVRGCWVLDLLLGKS